MSMYTFSQWVFFFYIYCFLGWVWESTYVSIKERHLVNRGFLKGPLLPIYGTGALCILIVTIPFQDNVPLMCLAGMVSATALEYVTGAAMEKIFHVRYWDYTGKFMNLNGHICLASTLCWGVMTVLVVDVFQVYLERLVLAIDEQVVTVLVFVITPVVTADLVTSFRAAIHLRDLLIQWERAREELEKLSERRTELEAALAARRAELEKSVNEQRAMLENAVSEQREALEKAASEQREALETAVNEQRAALETAMNERRQGLETAVSERRQDLETAVNERRRGLETAVNEGKQGLQNAMSEGRQGLESAVNNSVQSLESVLGEWKLNLAELLNEPKKEHTAASEKDAASGGALLSSIRELMDKITAVQEKENRMKAENNLMRQMHSKSVRGLLKRNPRAVSFTNKEAFADLKKFMMKKQDEAKADDGNDDDGTNTDINTDINTDEVRSHDTDILAADK